MITNAIVNYPKTYTVTEDGWEQQFAGSHLAHFLLVKLIWPLVLKARSDAFAPRIVVISSVAHQFSPLLEDLTFKNGEEYKVMGGYANAKTSNLLFVHELNKRVKGQGVLVFGLHPGGGS